MNIRNNSGVISAYMSVIEMEKELRKQGKEIQARRSRQGYALRWGDIDEMPKSEVHNTQKIIADALGWSTGKLYRVKKIYHDADIAMLQSVEDGEISVYRACRSLRQIQRDWALHPSEFDVTQYRFHEVAHSIYSTIKSYHSAPRSEQIKFRDTFDMQSGYDQVTPHGYAHIYILHQRTVTVDDVLSDDKHNDFGNCHIGTVKYVGQTIDPGQRIKVHTESPGSLLKVLWTAHLYNQFNTLPTMTLVSCVPSGEAHAVEKEFIDLFSDAERMRHSDAVEGDGFPLFNRV